MINPNVEQLESLISAVVNNLYKEVPPTEDEFLEKATLLRNTNAPIMPVSDDEFAEIISRLKQSLVIQMDVGVYINDRNNGHQSWLPSKRADFDFFFWNRYKKYLEEIKHWNPRVTTNLGKVSDEILDLCGDPSEDHFAIKGLVLGDVQSGKTANYTAICNKAADTGYRIIIVLAGMQENLRKQTQERLDAECTGRKSEYYLDPKAEQGIKNQPVGVGRYGTDKKIVAFTSVTKDFDSGILRNNNLGIENVNCPVILVVKKNKRILNNLIKWLSDNNTQNAAGQIDLPLMLIDDEADNASVNTKDEDSQPAAINDCISATAMDVEIEDTNHGRFITFVRDFQIINGGQTTASISNARYKDKADLSSIFVQMKLTSIDESTPEESDELIRNISRSSNSQNKVSDADFFASHPFHRRMEQISRHLFAPASEGAQYETKWFYERARGQYLQEQMRLTPAKKKQFELQHPKNKVIKKTDLAKVQNTWRGFPQIVSKGAQTNFNSFAEYIDEQWNTNEEQFNERYFQTTAALILLFQYLEKTIPKQPWYEGGYRANIIYYTLAQFRRLLHSQYQGQELDLMLIWNRQSVPEQVGTVLIALAERVLLRITDPSRKVANVTQWCKRNDCWEDVKKIHIDIPEDIENYLITIDEQKDAQKSAKKEQKVVNEIQAQTTVVNYPVEMWMRLSEFVVRNHMVTPTDVSALAIACKMPAKIPNTYQCKRLLALLRKASEEGFNIEA